MGQKRWVVTIFMDRHNGELKDPSCQKVSEFMVSLLINNKLFITRATYNTFIYNVFV